MTPTTGPEGKQSSTVLVGGICLNRQPFRFDLNWRRVFALRVRRAIVGSAMGSTTSAHSSRFECGKYPGRHFEKKSPRMEAVSTG